MKAALAFAMLCYAMGTVKQQSDHPRRIRLVPFVLHIRDSLSCSGASDGNKHNARNYSNTLD